MSDIIAKEKIYSKYENVEQTLVHPETQVAQIVDFREGVIDALPEDVVYKGDNVSLLNNDAGYINNVEATTIANTQVASYTYDKPTIDNKASSLRNEIDSLLHEKDGKIQELKDKLDDTYARLKAYMDANDFLNLAPKIGYYQEDEMQAVSKYNINNMEITYRMSPVITTDNTGKEVMYFIANNGGPDRETNEGLHKAYKINETSNWVYYNTHVVPHCLKSEINNGGHIKVIIGCDNDYLIIKFVTSSNAEKWYLIFTNFSFDENEWRSKVDITKIINHNNVSGANLVPDTGEWLMHIKYIKDYDRLVTITAKSSKFYEKEWYRMRVYKFSTIEANQTNDTVITPIRTIELAGFSSVVNSGDDYSFSNNSDVYIPIGTSGLTDDQISSITATHGASALCNQFIAGTNENNSVGGQALYLHDKGKLVITIYTLNSGCLFKKPNYGKASKRVGGFGNFALIFNVPLTVISSSTASGTVTLKTPANAYNFTDAYNSLAFNELYAIDHRYGHNDAITAFARFITGRCNNSSYDSYNGRAYYTSYNSSNKKWRYSRLINADQTHDVWGGVLTEKDYAETYISDASDWGKGIMNGGFVMWDKVVLSCSSAKNNGNRLVWIKKWKYIDGFENGLNIEPDIGQYQLLTADETTNVLSNATTISSEKTLNIDDKYRTFSWNPSGVAITSCRYKQNSSSSEEAKYYHAEFVKESVVNGSNNTILSETGHFDLYEFHDDTYLDDSGNQIFKIRVSLLDDKSVTGVTISKSDFNLTNTQAYSDDASKVIINNYRCFYNPMAFNNQGVFLISGNLDGGSNDNPNFKYANFIAVKSDGTVIKMLSPANNGDIGGPAGVIDNTFGTFKNQQTIYKNRHEYRLVIATTACCLSATSMLIGFTISTVTGISVVTALYEFDSSYTSYTAKLISSLGSGITHGDGTYSTGMYMRTTLHYGGPKLGLTGLGICTGDTSYFATYHNNIRTQRPIFKNSSGTSVTTYNQKEYTDEEVLDGVVSASNINIYTVWLQASSGLICYIPSGPIFLGGYYSVIDTPISIPLSANLRTENIGETKTLTINPSTGSSKNGINTLPNETITVSVSDGNYDANYIYLKRDPDDRENIIAYASPKKIIYEGSRQFNIILVAKVETDNEKCCKDMTYYRVNTGYNDYSF